MVGSVGTTLDIVAAAIGTIGTIGTIGGCDAAVGGRCDDDRPHQREWLMKTFALQIPASPASYVSRTVANP